MEQYTGLEPVHPAWKAGRLTIEPQYCKLRYSLLPLLVGVFERVKVNFPLVEGVGLEPLSHIPNVGC